MKNDNKYTSLKVLAGSGCNREIGILDLMVSDGKIYDASLGLEFEIIASEGYGGLIGWGDLDCEESYDLQPEGCAWWVSLPKKKWFDFCEKNGVKMRFSGFAN